MSTLTRTRVCQFCALAPRRPEEDQTLLDLVSRHGFDMAAIQPLHVKHRSHASLQQRFYKLCHEPGLEGAVADARRTRDYSRLADAFRRVRSQRRQRRDVSQAADDIAHGSRCEAPGETACGEEGSASESEPDGEGGEGRRTSLHTAPPGTSASGSSSTRSRATKSKRRRQRAWRYVVMPGGLAPGRCRAGLVVPTVSTSV